MASGLRNVGNLKVVRTVFVKTDLYKVLLQYTLLYTLAVTGLHIGCFLYVYD